MKTKSLVIALSFLTFGTTFCTKNETSSLDPEPKSGINLINFSESMNEVNAKAHDYFLHHSGDNLVVNRNNKILSNSNAQKANKDSGTQRLPDDQLPNCVDMTGMSPYTFLPSSPPTASTNKIFNEKNYNNPSDPTATSFNQNAYTSFTTDVINNSGANTYYNASSGITITNISEKTRTYANDFIKSDKAVTDTYYYGLLSGSLTYDGTGEELIRRLQSNINN